MGRRHIPAATGRCRRPLPVALLATLALAAPSAAATPEGRVGPFAFSHSVQIRLRLEAGRDLDLRGYRPGHSDTFALSRLSLDLDLRAADRPSFHLQLRDARPIDSQLGDRDFKASNPIHDPLDVREAFVQWRRIRGSPLGFTVGRQRITYGDERVFGPGEWGNTGRWTWDAARAHLERGGWWAEAWMGRAVVNRPERRPNSSRDGVQAVVLYGGFRHQRDRVDVFAGEKRDDTVRQGETGRGRLRCRFVGAQTEASLAGRWRWGLTAVRESGEAAGDSIDAFGASGWVSAALGGAWQAVATASTTYGSGDRRPDDGVHGTFDGVFGGADIRYYGHLNLFFWANLWDHDARVELRPLRALALRLEAHRFRLAQARDAWTSTGLQPARRDRSGAAGQDLGWEVDARATFNPSPAWEVAGGGGHFVPGTFVRRTGAAPHARWWFLQLTWRR